MMVIIEEEAVVGLAIKETSNIVAAEAAMKEAIASKITEETSTQVRSLSRTRKTT